MSRSPRTRSGITLIEVAILLVMCVVIVGTLLPELSGSRRGLDEAVLKQNLQTLRTQLEIYRDNHGDVYPTAEIAQQLTSRTTPDGSLANDGSCGPYLAGGIPPNPFNGLRTIAVVAPATANNLPADAGWVYDPTTAMIYPADSPASFTAYGGPQSRD